MKNLINKFKKIIKFLVWFLNPVSGASFIDRIMPPGGKRRIEYDKKQTEKKYKSKVDNYFKLTDKQTAEYWKGIDHRKYLRYEKNKKQQEENKLTDYEKFVIENELTDQELETQCKKKFRNKPKISIVVPLYNTNIDFFRELLYTIHCQTYKKWELCLADGSEKKLDEIEKMCEKDTRIKYKFLGENKGISQNTNEAIKMATGEFISLLDHDDMLSLNALFEVVKCINNNKNVDFIYSDEDKFHFLDEPRFLPHFKPDYAPDTLRANNYICHYSVIKKELLNRVGLFNNGYDGAQDYDLILRVTEKANKIIHIPKVLYHWRVHKESTAMSSDAKPYAFEAGIRALSAHLDRVNLKGTVNHGINMGTYTIDYNIIGNPKISILIIDNGNIEKCVNSLISKTNYNNYEIIIISSKKEIKLEDNKKNIKILNCGQAENNYSKLINLGVKNSTGEYIVQLNSNLEVITTRWLERMLGYAQRKDVGAVGVKIYNKDKSIKNAGFIITKDRIIELFKDLPKDKIGYFARESLIQNLNAVSCDCIITRKEIFKEINYMNKEYISNFYDVDFCLRIRKLNKLIIYNPYIEFINNENNEIDKKKYEADKSLFINEWKEKLEIPDQYFNPNFDVESNLYDYKI